MAEEPQTVAELEQKLVGLTTEREQAQSDLIYARNAIKVREEALKPEQKFEPSDSQDDAESGESQEVE